MFQCCNLGLFCSFFMMPLIYYIFYCSYYNWSDGLWFDKLSLTKTMSAFYITLAMNEFVGFYNCLIYSIISFLA